MEDRNIDYSPVPRCSEALKLYSSGIAGLRAQALDIAEDVLSKPPAYWNSNPEVASGVLSHLERIELSESLLDRYKDAHCSSNE